jgi:hypothetical protein
MRHTGATPWCGVLLTCWSSSPRRPWQSACYPACAHRERYRRDGGVRIGVGQPHDGGAGVRHRRPAVQRGVVPPPAAGRRAIVGRADPAPHRTPVPRHRKGHRLRADAPGHDTRTPGTRPGACRMCHSPCWAWPRWSCPGAATRCGSGRDGRHGVGWCPARAVQPAGRQHRHDRNPHHRGLHPLVALHHRPAVRSVRLRHCS